MEGTSDPDYGTCVDIVTRGALKAMIVPGILPIAGPIAVGLIFRGFGVTAENLPVGAVAVAAFLMVATIAGILMALMMNNGGGAWDNAKKFIETGAFGGKGSDVHKATVVGDTVGDPFKDTAGPSLHVLIKLSARSRWLPLRCSCNLSVSLATQGPWIFGSRAFLFGRR